MSLDRLSNVGWGSSCNIVNFLANLNKFHAFALARPIGAFALTDKDIVGLTPSSIHNTKKPATVCPSEAQPPKYCFPDPHFNFEVKLVDLH